MQRVERLANLLKQFDGYQIGKSDSRRVEFDVALLLQYLEYEDRIKQLEKEVSDLTDKIVFYQNREMLETIEKSYGTKKDI